MESKQIKITARGDSRIQLRIIPGHFATSQSHITHYLDLTGMRSRCSEAQYIAKSMASDYVTSTLVDTIVCMDGLEIIGAYLADELTKSGIHSLNAHQTMYIIAPEVVNGQGIFRDNLKPMLKNKNVLIICGNISTGETLSKMVEMILYYGGKINGISAIFSTVNKIERLPVYSIYQQKDIPKYETYKTHECPMCKRGEKLEAIVNGFGYSKL